MNNPNKPKHTLGPWEIVYATSDGTTITVRDVEHRKGYLGKFETTVISEDGRVNWKQARLIAAAPEMLEALELTNAYLLSISNHPDIHNATALHLRLQALIAKATGGAE